MQNKPTNLEPPGKRVSAKGLQADKGKAFAAFLKDKGSEVFATLVELRRSEEHKADVVVFVVQVERPQKVVHAIRRDETLAVVFIDSDGSSPEVLALRSDFPLVPHTNLRAKEFPRSLCLYDQPYENVRQEWTPANFLSRIRHWLKETATGKLHAEDQPLEPLIVAADGRLVLPAESSFADLTKSGAVFTLYRCGDSADEVTLIARQGEQTRNTKPDTVAVAFQCVPQTHGVIRHAPENLQELHDLTVAAGINLADALATKLQAWMVNKPTADLLKCRLVIILILPKQRHAGGAVENTEERAFWTLQSVEEIAIALGVVGKGGGSTAYLLRKADVSTDQLAKIEILTLQVLRALSPKLAAAMNGNNADEQQIMAVGMGALGSQVFNNLIRSGFGRWTLVDLDVLLPHNCARHFLSEWAVGHNKANAMAAVANALLEQSPTAGPIAKSIPADFLRPGKHAEELSKSYDEAKLVLDFSASVAVSRHLSGTKHKNRHVAAFLAPSGKSLIITAEDKKRKHRLDWLEMLHYRAVLNEPKLKESLQSPHSKFRYGNSCRDVSVMLAQDNVAIWAGIASRTLKQLNDEPKAEVRIYNESADGEISCFKQEVAKVSEAPLCGWTLRFDAWLIKKFKNLREKRLPNETGGVLLGNFDTHRRVCSIVDVIPSPPDSTEWPTSYIRGCAGLPERLEQIEAQTQGQILYVGEWHSHPDGAGVTPSGEDWKAYGWVAERMEAETLPAIMLIVGSHNRFLFVGQDGSKS